MRVYRTHKNFNIGLEKAGSENTVHIVNMKRNVQLQASPPYLIKKHYCPCKIHYKKY